MPLAWVRPQPGPFSVVNLPDTQFYTTDELVGLGIFESQVQMTLDKKTEWNVKAMLHSGDIIEDYNVSVQGQRAYDALNPLRGVVRSGLAHGNHDRIYDPGTVHPTYFGHEWYAGQSGLLSTAVYTGATPNRTYGMAMDIYAGWMAICVGWIHAAENLDDETTIEDEGGEDATMQRAKRLLRYVRDTALAYPDHKIILVFHQNLLENGNRAPGYDWIFDNVVSLLPNIKIVLNGHELGLTAEARRQTDLGTHVVTEILANYQGRTNGGNGWLRRFQFFPSTKTVEVSTYSPYLDQSETDGSSEFSFNWDVAA